MLNVAMLSKWHVHAEGYAKTVLDTGLAEITAVWDDDADRGSAWAKTLNCRYFNCLDELLAAPDIDAVICDAPTTQHFEVIKKSALAGKHIFTEKALAPTVAECEKLAEIIERSGVTFTISLPQRTDPVIRFAKKMIDERAFGKISLVRIRNGHDGVSGGWLPDYWFNAADAAGGSLMDLGCHPMYTANYLLGKPKRITALLTSLFDTGLDESATVSIEYENGAVCTGETSFVSYMTPGSVEIYGSEATLIANGGQVQLFAKGMEPYVGKHAVTPDLPEKMPIPLILFIEACINGSGTPENYSPRDGVELTRLLENAYRSNQENRTVSL